MFHDSNGIAAFGFGHDLASDIPNYCTQLEIMTAS
jgi:hypothetical protein